MKICILEADRPTDAQQLSIGTYAGMFERWLGDVLPEAEYTHLFVAGGAPLPGDPDDYDAYLITGSRAGAYEDYPWIAPLEDFLRAAAAARRPVLGVCFGHQIMAQAFGGRVEKSEGGWQLGRKEHQLTPEGAARFGEGPLAALSFHQDQITELPPTARRLLSNEASPNGGLEYEGFPALSVQFHPEFHPVHVKTFLDDASEARLPKELADRAERGLYDPLDNGRVAEGFAAFLRDHIVKGP